MIAFVGSVFSPYYAWTQWEAPNNHCALNVALYGVTNRWAMTERRERDVERTAATFKVGPSVLRQTGDRIEIDIDEIGMPFPRRLRGRVSIKLPYENPRAFSLDANGDHHWRPICPSAAFAVDMSSPQLSWTGHGYVDTNFGAHPLEHAFDYWDWSRTPLKGGHTLIRYVADGRGGHRNALALSVDQTGRLSEVSPGEDVSLNPTPIWRIPRRTAALDGRLPDKVQTLEDTPFYSRSLLTYPEAAGPTIHESLSGRRLRAPIVKAMLPFRMPRRSA